MGAVVTNDNLFLGCKSCEKSFKKVNKKKWFKKKGTAWFESLIIKVPVIQNALFVFLYVRVFIEKI